MPVVTCGADGVNEDVRVVHTLHAGARKLEHSTLHTSTHGPRATLHPHPDALERPRAGATHVQSDSC